MPYGVLDPTTAEAAPALAIGTPNTSVGYTLDSMSIELSLQLAGRVDVASERLTQFINDSYVDLCTSIDLPELRASYGFNTVSGQALYKVPPQVFATLGAAVVDETTYTFDGGRPLDKIDLDAYRREPKISEEPDSYFLHNGMIVLYPTPKAVRAIGVDFLVRPLPLVLGTDSPFLGREWHEVILKGARAKAFDGLLEFDLAQLAENTFISLVRRKRSPLEEEDQGRLIGSQVPKHRSDLFRNRRGSSRSRDNDLY